MLADITIINNFLSVEAKGRFSLFDHVKHFLACGSESHEFFLIRDDLLTTGVIRKICHFVSEHTKPAPLPRDCFITISKDGNDTFMINDALYKKVIQISQRDVTIGRFQRILRNSGSKKKVQKIPLKYQNIVGDIELCLNEKIAILYLITEACYQAKVDRIEINDEFRSTLSDGANHIVHQYLLSLYNRVPFKHPHIRHLLRIIGPFVTILDCTHHFYPLNNILPALEKNHQRVEALFPSAKQIILGHFRLSPEEAYNPLIFLGQLIDYPNRKDKKELGIVIKEKLPDDLIKCIKRYFPASTYEPREDITSEMIQKVQEKLKTHFKGEHHHSDFKALSLCATEQIPFMGPIQGVIEHFPTEDSALAAATAFNFVGEIAESLLRVLEISHVVGVSHLLEEMHAVFEGALSALPIAGTILLTTSMVKHAIHLDKLSCFKGRMKGLSKAMENQTIKQRKKIIKKFLGKDYFPSNRTIKKMILSATKKVDSRLHYESLEAFASTYAKKTIQIQRERGLKEIYRGLYSIVEKNISEKKTDSMIKEMIGNLDKRIANEFILLMKTVATLGFSAAGMITPINPIVILTVLGTNVIASVGLTWHEHHLVEQEYLRNFS